MGRKSIIDKVTKIGVVKDYLNGKASYLTLANEVGVSWNTVQLWVNEYRVLGADSFEEKKFNKSYSSEFQLRIIKKYLAGEGTLRSLCSLYSISSTSVLMNWIKKYNEGIQLKGYEPHPEVYHMKTRKTTVEERIEIARWCIDNQLNYKETAAKFSVSYPLVYRWVKKYLKDGESALKYQKRGRHVPLNLDLLTEEERLKAELETTKRKLQMAELTIEVLKKKKEIEKRLTSQESNMIRNTKPSKN
jgi:transposase